MFCSSASLFNYFFTGWKKFSIGFWVELATFEPQYQTQHSPLSKNSDWGLHPAGKISSLGCSYFQKHFQNALWQSLQKIVLLAALHTTHTELLHDHGENGYKHFHYFTSRALFFSFCATCQWQTSEFLRHVIAVVDLAWSHGLVLWVHEAPSKQNPVSLVQKSLEGISFNFWAKKNRVLVSCLDIKPFFCDYK